MQVLLKSSKQKAFETFVTINNTTLLFLKKQEKIALQTTAKGESPYFSYLFQGFPQIALISQVFLLKCWMYYLKSVS